MSDLASVETIGFILRLYEFDQVKKSAFLSTFGEFSMQQCTSLKHVCGVRMFFRISKCSFCNP